MDKIYLVKVDTGEYDSRDDFPLFASPNREKADQYKNRYNTLLKDLKNFYSRFEEGDEVLGTVWIKEEYAEEWFDKWYKIRNINGCFVEEIEVR